MSSCKRLAPPAVVALCAGSLLSACFGDPAGLEACTFTDPTFCGQPGATSSSGPGSGLASGTTSGGTSGGTSGEAASEAASGAAAGTGTTGSETGETTGAPIDPPPWVDDLVLDPLQAFELGPTLVHYKASEDAVSAQLLDDGAVIGEAPVGEPLVFPVTSAPHNNPGSTLTVVVRDEAGQTGSADIYQPSNVKPPGSHVWKTQEPGDGDFSLGAAVALQGALAVTAGVRWQNGKMVGTLRRYDQAGKWKGSDNGWTKDHPSWTKLPELVNASLSLSAVAVDAEGYIVVAGTALIGNDTRMYVARFYPSGIRHWELLEGAGTAGRGVAVQPDGTIYVTGSLMTGEAPERFDLKTWVYSKDRTAHGEDTFNDPKDLTEDFSERGRAVTALKDGRVVVVGTAEVWNQQDPWNLRTVVILYEGKGTRVDVWTSPGDKMKHDAGLAAVATDDGFALCGHAQADVNDPKDKTQILIRWFGADLKEAKAPRLELTPGAAACNALGYNRDGSVIVGAEVNKGVQGNDMWIFAVPDAAAPLVDYLKYNGAEGGSDRVVGLTCDYMCAWVGAEQVNGASQWVAGMVRG